MNMAEVLENTNHALKNAKPEDIPYIKQFFEQSIKESKISQNLLESLTLYKNIKTKLGE